MKQKNFHSAIWAILNAMHFTCVHEAEALVTDDVASSQAMHFTCVHEAEEKKVEKAEALQADAFHMRA